nr:hypothetical protein [Tanacetum cinerariifolium]
MEALIEDENAMDKGVADTMKDHKKSIMMMKILQLNQTRVRRPRGEELKSMNLLRSHPSPWKPQKVKLQLKDLKLICLLRQRNQLKKLVARDDNPPQDTSEPKTRKTLNPYWFKQPLRPLTFDPEWNKHQVVLDQPAQPWFNQLVSALKDPLTFNNLMTTPINFSKYVLNGLKIENLTDQDILLGPAFNLLKGTCSSSIKLEYNFQERFNALTDKLD